MVGRAQPGGMYQRSGILLFLIVVRGRGMHQRPRNLLFGIVVRGRDMLQWVGSLLFRVDGGRTDCFGVRSPMDGGLDTIHLKKNMCAESIGVTLSPVLFC